MKSIATFRRATAADAHLIATISRQSFEEAFGAANTPENLAAFLITNFTPEITAKELTEPNFEFYLAEINNVPAGYLKLQFPADDERVSFQKTLKVCRLYLLQQFLGLGLGDQLMHFSLEKARQLGCRAVWLTVWEHNPRAISFYQKWGFHQVSTEDFTLGNDVQLDYLLVKPL